MTKILFIDTETTGLVPKITVPGKRLGTTKTEQIPYETAYMDYPYIVEIAWKINLDSQSKSYIINQEGREIPKEASDIHKITTEMANDSKHTLPEVLNKLFLDSIGTEIVVGQNIYYDTSIIKANILREIHNGKISREEGIFEAFTEILHKHKRIDTMRSTLKMMGKWSSLSEIYFKIFHKGFNCHSAKDDVEAVAKIYEWLEKKGMVPTLEDLKQKAKEKRS